MRKMGSVVASAALIAVLATPLAAVVNRPAEAAAPAAATPAAPEAPAAVTPATVSLAPVEPVCGLAQPGYSHCLALRRTDIAAKPASAVSPATPPPGFGPADLQSAYALPGGAAGTGMTVAIVDAYDLSTAEADLAVYRAQYGLPACTTANGCFRKVNQSGGTSYPAADAGWGQEIALDIDMVSAACPNCHILLVETNTASSADLGTGVNTAVSLGAMAVSNSYGRLELSADPSADAAYYNHPGVAITAASGDWGYDAAPLGSTLYQGVEYPAASPDVVAVGGTSLVKDGSARGWTESAWGNATDKDGAGSGCATYEPKPAWQTDSCAKRMLADVSAVADPNTGVASYDSGTGGWSVMGGTSASSPIIAAVFALAGTPAAGSYPARFLYSDAAELNDVTSGNNDVWGLCSVAYYCNGRGGYDGPTGLGTPKGVNAFWGQLPGKVSGASAIADHTSAVVSWDALPPHGTRSLSYTVTSSPDGKTCTTTDGSIACTVYGLSDGTPYTFRVAATNFLGAGPSSDPTSAVTPGPGHAVQVAAGNGQSCALLVNGTVECWGDNYYGELGDGTLTSRSTPAAVYGLKGVTAITAGDRLTCAVMNDGTARCWGDNTLGTLGIGSAIGYVMVPTAVSGLTGITAMSASLSNTCAVAGGAVACWGSGTYGILGPYGSMYGSNVPFVISGISGATRVATGANFACALVSGGHVECWGYNVYGQLGDGTQSQSESAPQAVQGVSGAVEIESGGGHTCARLSGGSVVCWGYNTDGQTSGGSVFYTTPITVSGISDATELTTGYSHSCAVLSTGKMKCWGYNLDGELGNGTTTNAHSPTAVISLNGAASAAGGGDHTCALLASGAVKCWGANPGGELGDGTRNQSLGPVAVVSFPTVPGPPSGVTAQVVDQGALVSWTAATDTGGYAITGYTVTASDGAHSCSWTSGATRCTVGGLTNGNSYTFTVTTTTSFGTSVPSDPSNSITPSAVPTVPTGVTAVRGDQSAQVSWQASTSNGSPVSGYTVTSSPENRTCTWTSGPTSCSVAGLVNGQSYTFTVTATNSQGTSPVSDPSNSVTPAGVPGHPTAVYAYPRDSSVTVQVDFWYLDANGSPVTSFTVTASDGIHSCTVTDLSLAQCTVYGLTNGTSYTFTATATNGVGTSQPSPSSFPAIPVAVPAKPTNVTATAGVNSALVSWAAPDDNGSAITGYRVTDASGFYICTWTSGPLSCSVPNLVNGTSYTFTVTATNSVGIGPASDPSNSVTPAALPGKPTGVTAVAGNTTAVVSWTAPADNGGSSVIAYSVTSSPDGRTCGWTSGPLSCTVSTLTNGQTYTFRVTATNGIGTGPVSDPSVGVVPGPQAAAFLVAGLPSQAVSGAAGNLTVTARDSGGNTVTGYLGTVHFTSSDPSAILPANYTFTGADAGVHTFSVTLKTYGTQSVTATDTLTSITGAQTGLVVTWPASTYFAVSPRRVLDTRPTVYSGNPFNIGLSGKFVAGTVRRFGVAGAHYVGGGNAPAIPANAVAVTGNLTIVYETAPGVIDLGPAVTAGGATSSLNFVPGDTRANNVTLGLAADGSLSAVYRSSTAGATTDLIFDLTGYFLAGPGGATYHTVITPGRVLDTRPTYGGNIHIGPFTKVPNRSVRSFPIVGVTGLGWSSPQVPSGAVAVTGNVTVTNATSLGYVALGPTMTTTPSTSTANVAAGTNVANGVTVALSGGSLQVVWCGTNGSSADVIFDVTGYFTAGAGGLSYYPVMPVRVMDSSRNLGISGTFASRTAQLFTLPNVPTGAAGISGNFTLLLPTTNGWALITPEIVAAPKTSTVNASGGHSEANGFDVSIGASNHVALEWAGEVGSTANLSLDITGFWK